MEFLNAEFDVTISYQPINYIPLSFRYLEGPLRKYLLAYLFFLINGVEMSTVDLSLVPGGEPRPVYREESILLDVLLPLRTQCDMKCVKDCPEGLKCFGSVKEGLGTCCRIFSFSVFPKHTGRYELN